MASSKIPEDFPREPAPGAVPGTQPKLLARRIGATFVSGWTEEELVQRHVVCVDLVTQLIPYARRKHNANPAWSRTELENSLAAAIRAKPWGFTDSEISWMVRRVCEAL